MSCTPEDFTRQDLDQLRSAIDRRCAGHLSVQDREDVLGDILLAAVAAAKKTGIPVAKLAHKAAARTRYYSRSRNRVATIQSELTAMEKGEEAAESLHVVDPSELVDLLDLVGRLPASQRAAFTLHSLDDLTMEQAAGSMVALVSTTHVRVAAARRALRGWWLEAQTA